MNVNNLPLLPLLLLASFSTYAMKVIAHRGASAYAPENTIAAIKKADELNAPFIEIDVHQSFDKKIVVIHDSTLDRTTNGSGQINKSTLSEIKSLDAGSWFDKKFSSQKVPTLDEVLKLNTKAKVIIEVKDTSFGIEKNIFEIVIKNNALNRVLFKSFYPKVLKEFRKLAPNTDQVYVYVGSLGPFMIDSFLRFNSPLKRVDAEYHQVHRLFVNKSLVKRLKRAKKKVIIWGVNTKDQLESLKEYNVDLIETDIPDLNLR